MGNRVRKEGKEAVVGDNAVVKIGFAWGKSEKSGWFGVMKNLDYGVRRPAMVWLVAVGGWRDEDRS